MYELSPVEPSEEYINSKLMRATRYDTNCHRVGKIVAFNKEELTCDVELLELKPNISAGESEYAVLCQLPLIVEGTDDSWLTWGDIVGCECLVHFNDRNIDNWFATGEKYAPNTNRLHDLSDGFVTLRPRSKPKVFEYDDTGVVIHKGNVNIKLTADTVEITNGNAVFTMSGDTITVTGNLVVSGTINAQGTITSADDCVSGGISGKTHTHIGNAGSPTSPPQ